MCNVKTCSRCKTEKPIIHFSINRGKRRSTCRECVRQHAARRRAMQKAEAVKPENFDIGLQFNRWKWPSVILRYW